MFSIFFKDKFRDKTDLSSLYKRIRLYRRTLINVEYIKYNNTEIISWYKCDTLLDNISLIEDIIRDDLNVIKYTIINREYERYTLKHFLTDNDNNYDMEPEDNIIYLLDLLMSCVQYYELTLDNKKIHSNYIHIYIVNMVNIFETIYSTVNKE